MPNACKKTAVSVEKRMPTSAERATNQVRPLSPVRWHCDTANTGERALHQRKSSVNLLWQSNPAIQTRREEGEDLRRRKRQNHRREATEKTQGGEGSANVRLVITKQLSMKTGRTCGRWSSSSRPDITSCVPRKSRVTKWRNRESKKEIEPSHSWKSMYNGITL